jgi:hypothetical protein
MAAAGAAAGARTGQPAYTIKSPMAAAGARAGQPAYTIKRLGLHRAPKRPIFPGRYAAAAVGTVVALLAVGGVTLLSWTHIARHTGPAVAAPGPARSRGGSPTPGASPARSPTPGASSAAPRSRARGVPGGHRLIQWQKVTGIGCPQDDDVSFSSAPTGPGWTMAGGGWTGNGCAVWTMNPNDD